MKILGILTFGLIALAGLLMWLAARVGGQRNEPLMETVGFVMMLVGTVIALGIAD